MKFGKRSYVVNMEIKKTKQNKQKNKSLLKLPAFFCTISHPMSPLGGCCSASTLNSSHSYSSFPVVSLFSWFKIDEHGLKHKARSQSDQVITFC